MVQEELTDKKYQKLIDFYKENLMEVCRCKLS